MWRHATHTAQRRTCFAFSSEMRTKKTPMMEQMMPKPATQRGNAMRLWISSTFGVTPYRHKGDR